METKLTVADIMQWIDNVESLYRWRKGFRGDTRKFIRNNRAELERVIRAMMSGERRAY